MKLTKRILAIIMAALMLCSGMAVTSFANGEATEGTTPPAVTTPVIIKHTLTSANCYVDVENVEIIVKAAKAVVNGTAYDVVFSATQSDDATKTLRALTDPESGNTIFTNPVTGKKYKVMGTVKVDETEYIVADAFEVEVLKSQNAPNAPVAKKITSSSIEIANVTGCEYRIDNGAWGSKTTFDNLAPATFHTIEMRYKKTNTHYASAASAITVKTLATASLAVPAQPVFIDKTHNSITVREVEGVQFSINNGTSWQESGVFTGLKADTTYPIIARYKFDASTQEPNPACAPIEIRTNTRASYPADINNCKFSAADGENYANQPITISVTADTPAKYHDTQYGDTKYIPAYYTVGTSTTPNNFQSSDGKVFKGSFIPGDANANKKLAVNVFYNKMKCIGEDENGDAKWIVVGEEESKTYYVQVGESYTFFTDIRNFFLEIFNLLFNTLPGKINDLIKDIDLGAIMAGANDLFKALGGLDLGGITGGTSK